MRAIVDLKTADGKPTAAADPKLTPELPGVTDQESINDWDLPFELVEKIRPQDEDYWDEYRTTPKAFVSLATAKRPVAKPLGHDQPVAVATQPTLRVTPETVQDRLLGEIDPAALGMTFLPVKQQGLAAASGTTPFDALFLGFSFFLIAAAVMLIALLFQLGVEQRARELGTLSAVGIGRRRVASMLGREGLIVAAIGAAFGVAAGVLYAWLMITGLRTWWVAAIGTPFLRLHATPRSLLLGWIIGVAISWLTIRWSIRRLVRMPANRLLAGSTSSVQFKPSGTRTGVYTWPTLRWTLVLLITASLLSTLLAPLQTSSETIAGVFFATGAATLLLLLGEIRWRLKTFRRSARNPDGLALAGLSALNTARNPGRSTLTIGLVARQVS